MTELIDVEYNLYIIHTQEITGFVFQELDQDGYPYPEEEEEIFGDLREATPDVIKEHGYETDNETEDYGEGFYLVSVKHCAELTRDQFAEYVDDIGWFDRSDGPAGALTVEYGLIGAICLQDDRRELVDYPSAYVSVIPKRSEVDKLLSNIEESDPDRFERVKTRYQNEIQKIMDAVGEFGTGERDDLPDLTVDVS